MRKLGLVAAALMMTGVFHFTFHSSVAADAAAPAGGDAAVVNENDGNFACPYGGGWCGQGRGPGYGHRGMGMRQGGWHGGPMMHHRGEMTGRGQGMMRQGWRNWNNGDDRNDDGDDSRRGRRFGRGAGMQQRFGGMRQGMGMGMGMMPGIVDELNLTDEQRKQMIDVATENFRERLTLRWEMEKARRTLEELNDAETPDYNAIVAANEALGAARGKLVVAGRQMQDRYAAVLTAEQKAIIEQYRNGLDDGEEEDGNNDGNTDE